MLAQLAASTSRPIRISIISRVVVPVALGLRRPTRIYRPELAQRLREPWATDLVTGCVSSFRGTGWTTRSLVPAQTTGPGRVHPRAPGVGRTFGVPWSILTMTSITLFHW